MPEAVNSYDPRQDLSAYKDPGYTFLPSDLFEKFQASIQESQSLQLPLMWSLSLDQIIFKDLAELKNILIAGPPEIGKTNFIHQLILSLIATKHPAQIKFVMFDFKSLDFSIYKSLKKHFIAQILGEENTVVSSINAASNTLNSLCIEMDNRYDLLKNAGTKNIFNYNDKFIARQLYPGLGHQYLPTLVLIIDELADLILFPQNEIPLRRLLYEGYKTGIYSIISTNQFLGATLSNSILASIEWRAIFRLYDKDDYRRFFDTIKTEHHISKGEFLYSENAHIHKGSTILIGQNDIEEITGFISHQRGYQHAYLLPEYIDENDLETKEFDIADRDDLLEDAARLIVQNQVGSTSLLQRRMKLGYNRAGRLMDQLEALGIVGPNQGSAARNVLLKTELELEKHLKTLK
jgi:S-DNA-T family DNA segregation ATPase FtsK/SpoIIIE